MSTAWLFNKSIKVYHYIYNYIKLPLPPPDKYLDASLTNDNNKKNRGRTVQTPTKKQKPSLDGLLLAKNSRQQLLKGW